MHLFELIILNKPETKTNIQAYFIIYFEALKKNLKISIFHQYNDIKKRPKSLFYIEHVKFNTTSIPIYCCSYYLPPNHGCGNHNIDSKLALK